MCGLEHGCSAGGPSLISWRLTSTLCPLDTLTTDFNCCHGSYLFLSPTHTTPLCVLCSGVVAEQQPKPVGSRRRKRQVGGGRGDKGRVLLNSLENEMLQWALHGFQPAGPAGLEPTAGQLFLFKKSTTEY